MGYVGIFRPSALSILIRNSKHGGAGTDRVYKITWSFDKHLLFLNDNLVSCSTKANIPKETACSSSDDQECLYQSEKLALSKIPVGNLKD